MPVMKKRPHERPKQNNFGDRAFGPARFGHGLGTKAIDFEKTAVGLGRNALKVGREGYNLGKNMVWKREAIKEQSGRTLTEVELKPPTAEEELEHMRQRNVERLLNRFPQEVVEELGEIIEQAMEQQISARQMHDLLEKFFKKRYPNSNAANSEKWIRILLRVTHP